MQITPSAVATRLAIALTTAASAPALFAADQLPTVSVLASRSPVALDAVGSSVTVITADELEKRQTQLISDLLRSVPGVSLSRSGGPGRATSLRLRGAEPRHTLVFIDGVQVNDPSAIGSAFDFANLTTADVERIEVLRGEQSALWGADAIGGVINITTRRASEGVEKSLAVEGGSFATRSGRVGLRAAGDHSHFALTISRLTTDGISTVDEDRRQYTTLDGATSFEVGGASETDAYDNTTLTVAAGATLAEIDFELVLRRSDSSGDFDGSPDSTDAFFTEPDIANHSSELLETWRASASGASADGRLRSTLAVGAAKTDRLISDANFGDSLFTGRRETASYQLDYLPPLADDSLSGHEFSFALEGEREISRSSSSFSSFDESSRSRSAVLEYRLDHDDRLFLSAALRRDDNDRFGNASTGRLAASYRLGGGLRLHASHGTGVKNPTLFELFSSFGDPELQQEQSRGSDLGLEYRYGGGRHLLDLTAFSRTLEDEIGFDLGTFSYANRDGESDYKGIELSYRGQLDEAWSMAASWTHTRAEDASGRTLLRRPRNTASLQLDWQAGRFGANLGLHYTGDQQDEVSAGRVELDAYSLVNLAADYRWRDGWRLYGRIENLLDEDYQEVVGYGAAGAAAYLGLAAEL